ncbi:hypothetical protein CH63R_08786 [Colletotrichum higginsianum IMI 349063]|uniref:Uncharacterized protein n=2 Tax=Colletotrichum higginsianum TaxID=80884 RepID=A0A1B7Y5P2_COLHI|nr:hypothetical protein CH63R_08786 [Colletotrichum higginsianum IMI 349063]OBR07265.1 hypothetical protein CH63R_08786 [Colletotrichum higginsianum IMI 349063]TIC92731.1 hypothetical protein CH35J_010254 [Colletotrichum higginsianum]
MSSKRNSGDWTVVSTMTTPASRRPASVREKLSGFVRRGRGLAKKTTMSVLGESRHERPSLDESLHPKVLPRVQVQDFGTSSLDIDLLSLEAFRDVQQPEKKKEAEEQQQQKKPQRTTSSSTTPIADMFARKAATTTSTTTATIAPTAPAVVDQLPPSLDTSSPSLYAPSVRKPARAPTGERRPGPAAPAPAAASAAGAGAAHHHTALTAHSSTSSPAVTVTIISSSSHVQAHNPRPWPPPATSRTVAPTRAQPVPVASDSKPPARVQLREPRRAAFTPAAPAAAPFTATPGPLLARPRQHAGAAAVAEQQRLPPHHHHERQSAEKKRHSTPTAMPSLSSTTSTSPSTAATPAPNPLLAEILRTDRRRSWQPAPTSAPSAAAAAAAAPTPRPSAPPSASAPWRGIPNRQTSVRLGADRLAWIRELEARNRNRSSVNGDLPVLRTVQGSVADKLAKFESRQQEQQQQQQQQQLQKPLLQGPLTRSNSTRSRPSSIADTFSSYGGGGGGGAATTRSSLDSHRASSVFSHYDDSFREKLELITGKAGREADEEKKEEEKPPLTRVTSTFVSVERRRKQACVDKAQPV